MKRAAAEKEAADKEELDEEAKKEIAKLKATQDILMYKNICKLEVQDIAHIPKTIALTENQAINIYREILGDCNQCGFPITPLEELPTN